MEERRGRVGWMKGGARDGGDRGVVDGRIGLISLYPSPWSRVGNPGRDGVKAGTRHGGRCKGT